LAGLQQTDLEFLHLELCPVQNIQYGNASIAVATRAADQKPVSNLTAIRQNIIRNRLHRTEPNTIGRVCHEGEELM
jgi:hypothetical protein